MRRVCLARLAARNFRGIKNAAIDLNGRHLILLGDNGTGKTSWVDLFEYLLTGDLERLRRQDVSKRESIPFVGRQPGEPTWVEMTCTLTEDGRVSTHAIRATDPYRTPAAPLPLQRWFSSLQQRPPILRRAHVLNFVEARGADRYEQISAMIGLNAVDDILRAWRDLASEWRKEKQTLEREAERVEDALRSLGFASLSDSAIVAAVNERLSSLGLPGIASVAEAMSVPVTFGLSSAGDAEQAARLLSHVRDLEQSLAMLRSFATDYRAWYDQWRALMEQSHVLEAAVLSDLLEHARGILQAQPDRSSCPLCEQTISSPELLPRLTDRLTHLRAMQSRLRQVTDGLERVRRDLTAIRQRYEGAARACQERLPTAPQVLAALTEMDACLNADASRGPFPAPDAEPLVRCAHLLPELRSELDALRAEVERMQPEAVSGDALASAQWLGRLGLALTTYRDVQQRQRELSGYLSRITAMVDALLAAREKHVAAIHADIANVINSYTRLLHPGEEGASLQLPVENKGRAVGLRTDFYSMTYSHPSSYYSEGHLDSMGISVFLAFIERYSPDAGLLILDDVLTTIDAVHRKRMADVLVQRFGASQLIVTTHDRAWADDLCGALRRSGADALLLRLAPWDIERGVTWSPVE